MPQGINEKVPYPKKFQKFQLYHPKRNEALMKKFRTPKNSKSSNIESQVRCDIMITFRRLKKSYGGRVKGRFAYLRYFV